MLIYVVTDLHKEKLRAAGARPKPKAKAVAKADAKAGTDHAEGDGVPKASGKKVGSDASAKAIAKRISESTARDADHPQRAGAKTIAVAIPPPRNRSRTPRANAKGAGEAGAHTAAPKPAQGDDFICLCFFVCICEIVFAN